MTTGIVTFTKKIAASPTPSVLPILPRLPCLFWGWHLVSYMTKASTNSDRHSPSPTHTHQSGSKTQAVLKNETGFFYFIVLFLFPTKERGWTLQDTPLGCWVRAGRDTEDFERDREGIKLRTSPLCNFQGYFLQKKGLGMYLNSNAWCSPKCRGFSRIWQNSLSLNIRTEHFYPFDSKVPALRGQACMFYIELVFFKLLHYPLFKK